MDKLSDILNTNCNVFPCSESAWPCTGCVMRDFLYIIEDARNHNFKGSFYYSKKYLMNQILDYASENPVVTNLHAIALIDHYELNK